jgi:hypothetical protein
VRQVVTHPYGRSKVTQRQPERYSSLVPSKK